VPTTGPHPLTAHPYRCAVQVTTPLNLDIASPITSPGTRRRIDIKTTPRSWSGTLATDSCDDHVAPPPSPSQLPSPPTVDVRPATQHCAPSHAAVSSIPDAPAISSTVTTAHTIPCVVLPSPPVPAIGASNKFAPITSRHQLFLVCRVPYADAEVGSPIALLAIHVFPL
jgi:hypothetical protein